MPSLFGTSESPEVVELIELARNAGSIMLEGFGMKRTWKLKSDHTPVTPTDIKINELVLDWFAQHYPGVNVLAEEGNREVANAERTVLCDPLDGTICFSLGMPLSAFCISVLWGERPVMAVIYDPFQNRMWHAEAGKGAFLNGEKVFVSDHMQLENANMAAICWKNCGHSMHDIIGDMRNAGVKVQDSCSLVYFGGLIASGMMEGALFPGKGAWETAAMEAIVKEAGGIVTDLHGNQIMYRSQGYKLNNGSVVSNGHVHDELLQLVEKSQKRAA